MHDSYYIECEDRIITFLTSVMVLSDSVTILGIKMRLNYDYNRNEYY